MRHFAFRPSITMAGRANNGLRGLAGKPFHAPLTDVPIGAYLFAAVFDIISLAMGDGDAAESLYFVGTWLLLGGIGVSLLAALTGWADWHYSSEPGNQARRTINSHAIIMLSVTAVAIIDFLLRVTAFWGAESAPVTAMVLSIIAAVFIALGATYGGSLVFDYGFNVEVAGDSPVWAESEVNLLPGQHPAEEPEAEAPEAEAPADQPAAEQQQNQALPPETPTGQAR